MSSVIREYGLIQSQIEAITEGETDVIANLANISAILYHNLPKINWAGFYFYKENQLVLGPFQGQAACIRIPIGKGVCGTAAAQKETQLIDDVHKFEGHIACDAASNSEIVVPIMHHDSVYAVLDIDSPEYSRFNEVDREGVEKIAKHIEKLIMLSGIEN